MRVLGLVLLVFASTIARAGPGLDLIVITDRSGSTVHDAQLAPLVLQLAFDLVRRNAEMLRIEHRVAVIGFASSARVVLPFTAATELPQASLPGRTGGETNVLDAFTAADRLFRTLPHDATRRRAIVLLTDGVPYVSGADMTAYRANLQKFVRTQLAGVSIDVVLVRQSDNDFWATIGHAHPASRAADDVLVRTHEVVARLAGTRTVASAPAKTTPSVDELLVPPYLDVVVFDVFRGSRDATVELFPPKRAEPLREGANGVEVVGVGDTLATFIVPRPAAGRWLIRKSRGDARVRILSQQFFPRGVLIHPDEASMPRQHDRVGVAYRVIDSNGRAIDELRDYALALEMTLAKPNGTTRTLPMERAPELGPATFRLAQETECDLPGRYWTDVRVTTEDGQGHRVDVYRDRWSGFSVTPATLVDCRVDAWGSFAWQPVEMAIHCGNRMLAGNGSPSRLFRASLVRDGQPTESALDLRDDGNGTYRGSLRGASRSGTYQLQLTADPAELRESYNVRFLPRRVTLVRRTYIEWMLAAALLACAPLVLLRLRKTKS